MSGIYKLEIIESGFQASQTNYRMLENLTDNYGLRQRLGNITSF